MKIITIFWIYLGIVVLNVFLWNLNVFSVCSNPSSICSGWKVFLLLMNPLNIFVTVFLFQNLYNKDIRRGRTTSIIHEQDRQLVSEISSHITDQRIREANIKRQQETERQEWEKISKEYQEIRSKTVNPLQYMDINDKT